MVATKVLKKDAWEYPYLFSVCTIVNNHSEYEAMKNSFLQCGFTDECEYLIADNSQGNAFDAYQAIAAFLKTSQAKYLIIVHQDVICIDKKAQLVRCLTELTDTDNTWAICGNAGGVAYHEDAMYINNAGKVKISANLPARVISLDENFLVIRHDSNLTISADLSGFHMYATDLCLIADILGYHAYVIPFMVKHLSYGNLEELHRYTPEFIKSYGRKLKSRYVETTCTRFYLGNGAGKSRLLNFPPVLSIVKIGERIKQLVRLSRYGRQHRKTITTEIHQP